MLGALPRGNQEAAPQDNKSREEIEGERKMSSSAVVELQREINALKKRVRVLEKKLEEQ